MKILHHLCAYAALLSMSIAIAQPTIEAARQEITKGKEQPQATFVPLNGKPEASTGIYIIAPRLPAFRFRLVNAASEVDVDANIALSNKVAVCYFKWNPPVADTIPPNKKATGHILPGVEWAEADHWWYVSRTPESKYKSKVLWIPYLGEKNLFMQIETPGRTKVQRWWYFRDDILVDQNGQRLFPLKSTVGESSQGESSPFELSHQLSQQDPPSYIPQQSSTRQSDDNAAAPSGNSIEPQQQVSSRRVKRPRVAESTPAGPPNDYSLYSQMLQNEAAGMYDN